MTSYTVIERTAVLGASPERILTLLTDLRAWQRWSPWEGLDANLTRTYSGPHTGVGATYAWSGNRKAGSGVMTITGVTDTTVDIDLTFTRPFKSANRTGFTLAPEGDATRVTWRMEAPRTLGMRIAGLFMNMDKSIGGDFEKGLAALKGVVEGP
ncbi:MAG: SRPBCC family protein [Candidatus Nanopelagicales bacterium]